MVEFTGPSKHFLEQQFAAAMASIRVVTSNTDAESATQLLNAVIANCTELMPVTSSEQDNA